MKTLTDKEVLDFLENNAEYCSFSYKFNYMGTPHVQSNHIKNDVRGAVTRAVHSLKQLEMEGKLIKD